MSLLLSGVVDDGKSKPEVEHTHSEREKRVSNAVEFLLDSRVRRTPTSSKVHFLKSKGLSAEEICEAFTKVGQPKTLNEIKRILSERPYVPTGPNSQHMTQPLRDESADSVPTPHPNQSRRHTSLLYAPQAPPLPEAAAATRGVDWRDLVIGAGAAVIGGFAAFKAFQLYSPYEIRLKDEGSKPRSRRSRRGGRHASSDSEAERSLVHREVPALPVPAIPVASESHVDAKQAEIERLKTELKETQEALEAEKKGKAELSITLGKLRGQVTAYSRTNEKQESQIKSLQEEVNRLKSEIERKEDSAKVKANSNVEETLDSKEEGLPSSDTESSNPNGASSEVARDTQQQDGPAPLSTETDGTVVGGEAA